MALAETATLVAELNLRDNLTGSLNRVSGSLSRFQSGVGQTGRGMGQLAGGLARVGAVAAGAAATGLGYAATKAISFEDAFTGVRKTVNATDLSKAGLSFDKLSEQLREMSTRMPIAADDLARIAEAAGALGIAGGDIVSFTDVVAKLGVTTNLSTDEAATALGHLGTTLNLSGGEFKEFADSLVALGNAGASSEDQIIGVAERFAAAGTQAGLSKEEILALSSATASMGINIEAAGSSLSRVFNSVTTNIGTSSGKAVAFAKTLGLSMTEFKERWRTDALGTFQDFLAKLNTLDKFQAANILKKIGITGTRDINAIQLMAGNLDDVNDALKTSRTATGALGTEADKAFGSTANQLKILRGNIEEAARTIGDALLPKINELARKGTKWIQDNKEGIRDFADRVGKAFDSLMDRVDNADFSGLIDGFKMLSGISKGVVETFLKLPPQIQAIAVSGLALNKISGGLIGKGIGNIAGGLLKIAFARGESPARPLYVSAVVGLGGGLPGGAPGGGTGGIGKVFGFLAKLAIPVIVAEAAQQSWPSIFSSSQSVHDALGLPDLHIDDLQWPLGEKNTPDWVYDLGFATRAPTSGRGSGGYFGPPGAVSDQVDPGILSHAASERADATAADAAAKASALTAKEFMRKLGGTAFIGPKQYESIFEKFSRHPGRGTDPVGDKLLALVRELKNPRAPKVFDEIKGHVRELANVERTYLRRGNVVAAEAAEKNRQQLAHLLGIEVKVPPGLQRLRDKVHEIPQAVKRVESVEKGVAATSRKTADHTSQAIERIRAVESASKSTASNTGTIARQGPPNVSVGVVNTISVSTISGILQRQTVTTATNRVGGMIR